MKKKSLILGAVFAIVLALAFFSCKNSTGPDEDESAGTNYNTAFNNILNNRKWTIENPIAITEKDGVYTFDGRQSLGSIKRTLVLNEL